MPGAAVCYNTYYKIKTRYSNAYTYTYMHIFFGGKVCNKIKKYCVCLCAFFFSFIFLCFSSFPKYFTGIYFIYIAIKETTICSFLWSRNSYLGSVRSPYFCFFFLLFLATTSIQIYSTFLYIFVKWTMDKLLELMWNEV